MKVLFFYKYAYFEPLGVPYLSAVLKKHGHKTYFIDLQFTKNYVKETEDIAPDVIAYSITTGKHKLFRDLNLELKILEKRNRKGIRKFREKGKVILA